MKTELDYLEQGTGNAVLLLHSMATGVCWDRFYSSQQEMMFGPHDDL